MNRLLAALALTIAPTIAVASDLPPTAPIIPAAPSAGAFYATVLGGGALVDDLAYDSSKDISGETYLDNGYHAAAMLGYAFGNGWSVEGELGYIHADQNGGTYGPYEVPVTGTGTVAYGLVNAWYGFDLGNGITPFIGGGVGVANLTLDSVYTGDLFEASTFKDSATTYAAQIGGGVTLQLTDAVSLVGRYSYFKTGDVDFVDGQGTTLTSSFGSHLVDIGLKVTF